MAEEMEKKYCGKDSIPDSRGCVMEQWCKDLAMWKGVSVAPTIAPTVPEGWAPKLSHKAIAGIVIGSLIGVALLFVIGFVVGWIRKGWLQWTHRSTALETTNQEFSQMINEDIEL